MVVSAVSSALERDFAQLERRLFQAERDPIGRLHVENRKVLGARLGEHRWALGSILLEVVAGDTIGGGRGLELRPFAAGHAWNPFERVDPWVTCERVAHEDPKLAAGDVGRGREQRRQRSQYLERHVEAHLRRKRHLGGAPLELGSAFRPYTRALSGKDGERQQATHYENEERQAPRSNSRRRPLAGALRVGPCRHPK